MTGPIDRVAPARRPAGRAAGTQRWRELLFLHWEVDPAALRAVVPASLELDAYQGVHYVGVVPFLMRDIRVGWVPFAAFDFLETNVRCYVHRDGEPGVYFFSLEASSWLAVRAARMTFGLPYFHARMHHHRAIDGTVAYRAERRGQVAARHAVRYRPGDPIDVRDGSLEHFLVERYLLFVERRGALSRAQVHHAPYPVHRVTVLEIDDGLVAAGGLATRGAPIAHYSPGVDVEVFAPRPVAR